MFRFILPGLLLIFVTLKLLGKIDWSWFWVISPLYPALLILVGSLAFIAIVWIYRRFFESEEARKNREVREAAEQLLARFGRRR